MSQSSSGQGLNNLLIGSNSDNIGFRRYFMYGIHQHRLLVYIAISTYIQLYLEPALCFRLRTLSSLSPLDRSCCSNRPSVIQSEMCYFNGEPLKTPEEHLDR